MDDVSAAAARTAALVFLGLDFRPERRIFAFGSGDTPPCCVGRSEIDADGAAGAVASAGVEDAAGMMASDSLMRVHDDEGTDDIEENDKRPSCEGWIDNASNDDSRSRWAMSGEVEDEVDMVMGGSTRTESKGVCVPARESDLALEEWRT